MVPDGWKRAKIADLATVKIGGTPSRAIERYWSNENDNTDALPWVSIGDLNRDPVYWTKETITRIGADKSNVKLIKTGTVMMSFKLTIGRVARAGIDLYTNEAIAAFVPLSGMITDDYLYHVLPSAAESSETDQAVKGRTLNKEKLLNIEILIPPLHEQERIAEVLSSVDAAIEATKAVIDQTKTVKQGLLQTLLTRGIGHTQFKASPLGEIPESWKIAHFGNLINRMDGGVSVNSEDRPHGVGEIGILKTSAVSGGIFYPDKHKTVLPEEVSRVKVNPIKGGIIFSRMNTPDLVGENAYVESDYPDLYLPDRLWLITVADPTAISSRWLSQLMASDSFGNTLSEIATGTSGSMKNISKAKLNALPIAVPPIDEQLEIAESVLEISNHVAREMTKLAALQTLKKGLMNDLLTGKVRVGDLKVKTANNVIPFAAKAALKQPPEFALIPSADEHYLDALLAAEINSQLNGTPTFGSVKLEKILDITVRKLGFDEKIDRTAYQHAAGPYDAKARYKREEIFKQQGWFSVVKVADEAVRYPPTAKALAYKSDFETYFGYARSEIDRIITLFRHRDTDQCEIAATAYAIWNDFMIDKRSFDDNMIVHEFRYNWHPSKGRFTPTQVRDGLKWLRDNMLEPTGNGRKTKKLKGKA